MHLPSSAAMCPFLLIGKGKERIKKKKSVPSFGPNTNGTLLSCWPTLNFSLPLSRTVRMFYKKMSGAQLGKVECPKCPALPISTNEKC